jgi:hypothetical protein
MPEGERGRKGFLENSAPPPASKKSSTKRLLSPVGSPEKGTKRQSPSRNQVFRPKTARNNTNLVSLVILLLKSIAMIKAKVDSQPTKTVSRMCQKSSASGLPKRRGG